MMWAVRGRCSERGKQNKLTPSLLGKMARLWKYAHETDIDDDRKAAIRPTQKRWRVGLELRTKLDGGDCNGIPRRSTLVHSPR